MRRGSVATGAAAGFGAGCNAGGAAAAGAAAAIVSSARAASWRCKRCPTRQAQRAARRTQGQRQHATPGPATGSAQSTLLSWLGRCAVCCGRALARPSTNAHSLRYGRRTDSRTLRAPRAPQRLYDWQQSGEPTSPAPSALRRLRLTADGGQPQLCAARCSAVTAGSAPSRRRGAGLRCAGRALAAALHTWPDGVAARQGEGAVAWTL
jgi:hypothetical protein